jgi:hypothetical protein
MEDLDVDGRNNLKGILNKSVEKACTGLIWVMIGTNGEVMNFRVA